MIGRDTTNKPADDQGFHIGDRIRHTKSGFEGVIQKFDWCGIERAAHIPNGKSNKGWYVCVLGEIELVKSVDMAEMKPEPKEIA